jgi:hypothetical protein
VSGAVERGGAPRRQEPNPEPPEPLTDFRFCAVVKTYMDEDIIEATVRNAQVQGADAVFVVDNGSVDDTVTRAEGAGATVAEVYATDTFNGRIAQEFVNAVVARESLRGGDEHVWWLHLDSDEFPEGPAGLTLREFLATLDRRFRVVGSRFVNHVPHAKPEYRSGYHPIDFQPLYYEFRDSWTICGRPHWKHPLQRFDRNGRYLRSREGAHFVFGGGDLAEPEADVVTHHFQYREEETTRRKMAAASGERTDPGRQDGAFGQRLASLDAVYAQRWDGVVPAIPEPAPWAAMDQVRRWRPPPAGLPGP